MQAILLATRYGKKTSDLLNKCLFEINGVSLIERILKQLDNCELDRVIIICKKNDDKLQYAVSSLKLNKKIEFAFVNNDLEEDDISLLWHNKEILLSNDSIIIQSNLIFEDNILYNLINFESEAVIGVDKYKNWMTGYNVEINNITNKIKIVKNKDCFNYNNSYKTIGLGKISLSFLKNNNLSFVDAFIDKHSIDCTNSLIDSVFSFHSVDSYYINDMKWYEINDIQDIDLASIMFSDDEDFIVEELLGKWGGYWRYPEYLDYFYLVTPYYPTIELIEEMKDNFVNLLTQYPSGMKVNSLLASKEFFVEPDNIVIGNGAAELIKSIMSTLKGKTGFIKPTFEEYPNRLIKGESVIYYVNSDDFSYSSIDIINFFKNQGLNNLVLVNPENPSGNYINKKSMNLLLEWTKKEDIKFIVDESFVDFVDEENPSLIRQDVLSEYKNLYVLKSISKSYGVPGLRLGVLASGDKDTISWLKKDVSIWNINSFAEYYMQIAGKYHEDYNKALKMIKDERKLFQNELEKICDIKVIRSQANYIMVELLNGLDAEWLKHKMLIDEKIFIKTLNKKINNGKNYIRLAIRNHDDNIRLIMALKKVLISRNINERENINV